MGGSMSTLESEIAEIIERRFGCHTETAARAAREIIEHGVTVRRLAEKNAALRAQLAKAVEVGRMASLALISAGAGAWPEAQALRAFLSEMEASDDR